MYIHDFINIAKATFKIMKSCHLGKLHRFFSCETDSKILTTNSLFTFLTKKFRIKVSLSFISFIFLHNSDPYILFSKVLSGP